MYLNSALSTVALGGSERPGVLRCRFDSCDSSHKECRTALPMESFEAPHEHRGLIREAENNDLK